MALQVWLPLDGNLENKGLSNIKMVSTDAPTYTDNGKIGKAIVFLNNINTTIRDSNVCQDLKYTDNFSYCMWVKNVSKGSSNASFLFTVGRADTGSYGYGIHITSATQITFRFGDHTATKNIVNGEWNFIAFTKSGTTLTYYINGVVSTATFSGTLPSYISSEYGGLGIGCFHYSGNIYPCNATMNDFRIYDHCLSLKEIKDISKGLVLHYPLDSLYDIGSINKIDGTYSEGQFSFSDFQKTKLTNERGWHYTYNYTGTTSNTWPNASSPAFSYTIGKTYYYSLKVRCNTWTAGNLYLRASRSNNDYATNIIQICNPSKADGQWHEYYTYIKITGDTYNRSGTQVACSPRLEVYCSNLNSNGTVYTFDFDIKDIQVVESDTYLPYVDNSLTSNIVYDSSGYSRNGTNMGTLTIASDSPRYSKSLVFDGTTSAIQIVNPNIFPSVLNSDFTISMWIYNNDVGGRSIFFGNYGLTGGYFNIEKKTDERVRFYWSGKPDLTLNNCTLTASAWSHLVITRFGNTVKGYVNGVLKDTSTTTLQDLIPTGATIFRIGRDNRSDSTMFKGNISDFRIYATALSDEDVLELYNTSAILTDNGTLEEYEIIEDNLSDITKRGLVETSDFYEEGADDNHPLGTERTRVASNYITSREFVEL